jgi:aspartyl-tRNA(Asn)/glutamyl-tRNA(Gln) amidotransferase subunit A
MVSLFKMDTIELGIALRKGQVTSVEIARATLERISKVDPQIASFTTVTEERALEDARKADSAFGRGEDWGPMQGIPYALKDLYLTRGIRTTYGARRFAQHVPEKDSFVQTKFVAAGAVLVGKTTTNEFATSGPNVDTPWATVRNPWNTDHLPGGSSSGSAAAVAAGLVRVASGSDTGGSIRMPAANCGVVGFKPSYGLVSRNGVFPLAPSLDHAGPLGRSVNDCAVGLTVMAGHDPVDPGSVAIPQTDYTKRCELPRKDIRIGVVTNFYEGPAISEELPEHMETVIKRLQEMGFQVARISLPDLALFDAVGAIILQCEAHHIHRNDLVKDTSEYGPFAYARLSLGATIGSRDYLRCIDLKRRLSKEVLAKYDYLVSSLDAYPPGLMSTIDVTTPPVGTSHAMPFNVSGHPALALPAGFWKNGLPRAIQIVGRMFDDSGVLDFGAALEAEFGMANIWPAAASCD